MATRLVLTFGSHNGNGGAAFHDVEEDYDTVLNKVFPLEPPNSALAAREGTQYVKADGRRVMIHPQTVAYIEENPDDD